MKVIVTDEMSKEGLEILTEGSKLAVDVRPGIPADELLKVIGEYDAIILASREVRRRRRIEWIDEHEFVFDALFGERDARLAHERTGAGADQFHRVGGRFLG